jgi:hypothetical protein
MEGMSYECNTCGDQYQPRPGMAAGVTCPDLSCKGVLGEIATPSTEDAAKPDPAPEAKPKRTRKTNPLRWARRLFTAQATRKQAEQFAHLEDDPQMWGPEHPTITAAHKWLMTNGQSGFTYDLMRITQREMVCRETRQMTLLRRGESDDDYVQIGSLTR